MGSNDLRSRYLDDGLATAPPAKLLTMLWDRLLLDVTMAEQAIERGDVAVSGERLGHAQDIVFELRSTLRLDVWDGAAALASLYDYVAQRLVEANVRKDGSIVAECRALLEPLREAWHQAATNADDRRPAVAAVTA